MCGEPKLSQSTFFGLWSVQDMVQIICMCAFLFSALLLDIFSIKTWEPNLCWKWGLFLLRVAFGAVLTIREILRQCCYLGDYSFCFFQEACALQYYFLILWRILGILPPSKTYMNQLAMNSPEMSECDILHTLRWSSRLRISSYVNWIKVP